MSTPRWLAALPLAALLSGCPEPAPLFQQPYDTLGPIAVGGRVAWIDQRRGLVHLVTPTLDRDAAHDVVSIGHDPQVATTDAEGTRLLVVTHGTAGGPGVAAEDEALWVIDARTAATERWDVKSPFTAIGVHPDGHRLFLHFDQSVQQRSELVYNAHEIAVIDLDEPAGPNNPRLDTVRSFEQVPSRVVFAPPVQIAAEEIHFAAVLSADYVTLFDLDHADRTELSIPLTLDPTLDHVDPNEVVFHQPDPGVDPVLYVAASGAQDVFAFTLRGIEETTQGGHHFVVAPNLYAVGAMPSDLEPVALEDGDALLVTTGAPQLWIIDTRSSQATTVHLEAPATEVLPVPEADGVPAELLLWASGSSVVQFALLEGLADSVERQIDTVGLPGPVADVQLLPDGVSAAVVHSDAQRSISILRLDERAASALTATAPLDRSVWSADGATLFVASGYDARLSIIDVADRHPEDLRLDEDPTGLLLVPGADVLVVTHDSAEGLVTLIDATRPSRETARMLQGFLLEGLLDQRGERR